jgi:acetoin utilization deacetylase AcuC-like enzyme
MMLSVKDLQKRDETILSAFLRNRIPVAVLYGGGYNRTAEGTAKIHRNTVTTAAKLAKRFLK